MELSLRADTFSDRAIAGWMIEGERLHGATSENTR
jgi:hypothetical protein